MFTEGIEVNDETMCLDLIGELEFGEKKGAYSETEHTLRHFRDVLWDSKYLDRTYRKETSLKPSVHDSKLLEKAEQAWRQVVASQKPIELAPQFVAEVDRIVEAARKELLGE